MLLDELVATAEEVASTRSRRAKVETLARLLRRLAAESPEEIGIAVGMLVAKPRQGRVGVGWRGLSRTQGGAPPATVPSLDVRELDALLDRLAVTSGTGSGAARAGLLASFMGRATDREQRFIVGVLLGEMRTGALEGVLVEALAEAGGLPATLVRRAAMLSGDLGETARIAVTGTEDDLSGIGLLVGRPVLPMLAASATNPGEALAATGEASVEFKLDGARIQVHRAGDQVRVFTRSLADITQRAPEVVEVVRTLPVRDVILDGETLTLDEGGTPRPFQDTMSRFGTAQARDAVLRPWFFDILHVDGRDLLDEPLRVRRAELARLAPGLIVPGEVTADPETAERISREALGAGHEGIVVKAIDSPYSAGRRGSSWIKVKPVQTYDLVVLAAEWGSGRRHGWLSNLHLGAYDPTGEFGPPGGFVMVGKTFKGLTDDLLRWQTAHFPSLEVRRDAHAVFLEPRTVVEIAIDGVQRSSRYPGGIALRFARVKRYRDDKGPDGADTIQALRALLR